MPTCTVKWRPSGGRGEFEFVPADALMDRNIEVLFEPLDLVIPAEVAGRLAQGKPRLRKFDPDNRKKFHLPQLVMAVARLPEPAREDLTPVVVFPLENRSFVMDGMDFDIIGDDGTTVILAPLRISILHSDVVIELQDRLNAVAADLQDIAAIRSRHPNLAQAIEEHGREVKQGVNTTRIRDAADRIVGLQADIFGMTNAGSALVLERAAALPETDIEADIVGKEGRILTRIHAYKERDRTLSARAKQHYRSLQNGTLVCEACNRNPNDLYGVGGDRCIEAHHKVPIEQLQPDSITRLQDLAMVCASCHRIIHSQKPCLTISQMNQLLENNQP